MGKNPKYYSWGILNLTSLYFTVIDRKEKTVFKSIEDGIGILCRRRKKQIELEKGEAHDPGRCI